MRKTILTYLGLLAGIGFAKSQDFKQDMLALVNAQKVDKQCFSLTYNLRENHQSNSRVLYVSKGKYIKVKDACLSTLDHISSLTLKEEIITVDKNEQQLTISKLNQSSKAPTNDILQQIENYNQYIQKVTGTKLTNNAYQYTIVLKQTFSAISKYELVFDIKLKTILRMTLFYKTPIEEDKRYHITGKEIPRLDIEFTNYNDFKLLNEAECNASYYYTKNKNKLIPSSNFNGYDIKQL
jgi:hypothetical protein